MTVSPTLLLPGGRGGNDLSILTEKEKSSERKAPPFPFTNAFSLQSTFSPSCLSQFKKREREEGRKDGWTEGEEERRGEGGRGGKERGGKERGVERRAVEWTGVSSSLRLQALQ